MKRSTCKTCGAAIIWCRTAAGKAMPVDAEPVEGGNLALTPGALSVPTASVADLFTDPGPRYVSHFATCPDADQHRKER